MKSGVPKSYRAGLVLLGSLSTLLFAGSALGAPRRPGSCSPAARSPASRPPCL
jgi:hypothetical protein